MQWKCHYRGCRVSQPCVDKEGYFGEKKNLKQNMCLEKKKKGCKREKPNDIFVFSQGFNYYC